MGNCCWGSSPVLIHSKSTPNPSSPVPEEKGATMETEKKGVQASGQIVTPNLKMFKYGDLRSATHNFRPDSVVGEGGFGRVFKGWVDPKTYAPSKAGVGVQVTVKKSNPDSSQGLKEWQVVEAEKVTEALQGSPIESGPTAPLPDKKLLVFILDRLQKKDTYGVFSEPVDTKELPDYNEIIEHPMDFGTVRKKLDEGTYSNLDDFEADVLLICANAMQYNAPDTVYFRQAKSIEDIAKRDFQNLRQVNDEGVPQHKIVRRGRPPNLKKALSSPPLECIGPESSSDATLATGGDNNNNNNNNAVGSNSYNLRKGLAPVRFQSTDAFFRDSPQSRNNETYADSSREVESETKLANRTTIWFPRGSCNGS